MKGVYISTYGCQMNENDTERMYAILEQLQYEAVPAPDQADLIIINSCAVREKPVHKVFSEIGQYRKLKQKKPHLKIGIAGCVSTLHKQEITQKSDLVDFVIGPDNIDEIPEILARLDAAPSQPIIQTVFYHRKPYHESTQVRRVPVSVYVNITKGCDNFCTFCVVPFTRGRLRSRPLTDVIADVNRLAQNGAKEVFLLGQNVNSYRSECGADFADLLEALVNQTPISWIRFTTNHPKDFNQKLAQVMGRYGDRICGWVHLPVQSGDDEILKAMNRGYTRQQYLQKVQMIREWVPHVVLSTDVIVGFPGETQQAFENTLSLLDEVRFETVYAFKYSPRPFTKARLLPNPVTEEEKDHRLQVLLKHQEVISFDLAQRHVGQRKKVLVLDVDPARNVVTARSWDHKNVHFPLDSQMSIQPGDYVWVDIQQAYPNVLYGVYSSGGP